jgi:hypothetical protein
MVTSTRTSNIALKFSGVAQYTVRCWFLTFWRMGSRLMWSWGATLEYVLQYYKKQQTQFSNCLLIRSVNMPRKAGNWATHVKEVRPCVTKNISRICIYRDDIIRRAAFGFWPTWLFSYSIVRKGNVSWMTSVQFLVGAKIFAITSTPALCTTKILSNGKLLLCHLE